MSEKTTNKYQVLPPDESRCVWMTAGIVSYQLCDHRFDCDNCPLDLAMRKHFSAPGTLRPATRTGVAQQPALPDKLLRDDRRYSRNHCWIRQVDVNRLQVGLEPGLGLALLPLKAIVLPSFDQKLGRGDTSLWAVMDGGTFPIASPVEGTVINVNRRLAERPHLLSQEPFDGGWLFEVNPEGAAVESMSAAEAEPIYDVDESRFKSMLTQALRGSRPPAGITMADGGQQLQSVADMLGPTRYLSILRKIYG